MLIITKILKNPDSNIAFSSDGVKIHYEIHGKGEPTLLFVHGWCCDKNYWNKQIPYFLKFNRIVLLDLAGHGESGLNRNAWTIEAFGDDVACIAKKLGLTKIILIGHSMGGPVILEAARRLPNKVFGIIGVDTFHNIEQHAPQEEIDQGLASMRKDFQNSLIKNLPKNMFLPSSDPNLVEKIVKDMASEPPIVGIGAIESLWNYHSTPTRFKELQLPIRCINSFKNPTNVEAGKRHASSFDVKIMKDVGHFVMMEDPETFNNILDKVIKDLL